MTVAALIISSFFLQPSSALDALARSNQRLAEENAALVERVETLEAREAQHALDDDMISAMHEQTAALNSIGTILQQQAAAMDAAALSFSEVASWLTGGGVIAAISGLGVWQLRKRNGTSTPSE